MLYRKMDKLIETEEFLSFCDKFQINFKIIDSQICLINAHMLMSIYGHYSETCIYTELYIFDENQICSDLGSIEWEIEDKYILAIYDKNKNLHTVSLNSPDVPGSEKAEAAFFAKIEIIERFFSDPLQGDIKQYKKYFNTPNELEKRDIEKKRADFEK